MIDSTREKLYALLPAVYRRRDRESGEPLRALMAVLESQLERLENDIDTQYENWFVETCQDWVVPYLGRFLGDPLAENDYEGFANPRAWVGRLQEFRRGQGSLATLEQAIRCVTGWQAHCVEMQRLLVTTPRMDGSQPNRGIAVDVRNQASLRQLDGPFQGIEHRADVRRIESGGRYNLANLGIFLWRMISEPAHQMRAAEVEQGCYTFDPLGIDTPLYHRLPPDYRGRRRSRESDFPGPISRESLRSEIAAIYGSHKSFAIYDWQGLIPHENLVPCDLSRWDRSLPSRSTPNTAVAGRPILLIDAQRGRFALPTGVTQPESIRDSSGGNPWQVVFHRGRAGNLGGGMYDRTASLTDTKFANWPEDPGSGIAAAELGDALDAFHRHVGNGSPKGLIRILDNDAFVGTKPLAIVLPETGWLAIEAADGAQPCIRGRNRPLTIRVSGGGRDGTLILNGLRICGKLAIVDDTDSEGTLNLHLRHCTITGGITVAKRRVRALMEVTTEPRPDDLPLGVHLQNCVTGPIHLPSSIVELRIFDSVVDDTPLVSGSRSPPAHSHAIGGVSSSAFGPPLTIERTTVLGSVRVRQVTLAIDGLFEGSVESERLDVGTIRNCYLPPWGNVSIPAQASVWPPVFGSRTFGHPLYARLRRDNDPAIMTGATDRSEVGVFGSLRDKQREATLRQMLEHWVPVDLHAGLIYVT